MLTRSEIQAELLEYDIKLNKRTFFRWVQDGLAPEAVKKETGKASLYPDDTIEQFRASYKLLHSKKIKPSRELVGKSRKIANYIYEQYYDPIKECYKDDNLKSFLKSDLLAVLSKKWIKKYCKYRKENIEKIPEDKRDMKNYYKPKNVLQVLNAVGDELPGIYIKKNKSGD